MRTHAEFDEKRSLKPAFRTTDFTLLMIVKSLLDAAEIPYIVQGEEALHLFPLGPAAGLFNPQALSAVIFVDEDHLEQARQLIDNPGPPLEE